MTGTNFIITGNAAVLIEQLLKSKKAFGDLKNAAQTAGIDIDDVMTKVKQLAGLAGVSFGAAGIVSFTKKIYNARASMQDLESTMRVFLGSQEKAAKFTKELQDYAYWNMFEFTDLTEASTQLMAYGTATEELIPTIDKLSNIATGTKKPLEQYVNLFNKAKSTGKVDANGLQQWAAAGIVLKDELKKLGQQVDGNNVSFEQLQMVLNNVTSEGERFGGLMMSQMDNLSASWGQLEDNFANMLNELGEKLQDTFKGGIDFAGVLVDNYEKIGKALFALIAMYGEYKAVLVATSAIQKAQAFMENIKLIGMFRKELGLLKAAQQAFNITAMQNPYILMAAAIIMTCTAIWGLVSAFKDDRTEVEKLNDTYDDRVRALQEEQRQASEHIRTLKDETASTEALRNAREQLANMDAFKEAGISAAQLAYMSPEEIQKKMQEYYAQQEAQAKQEKKEGTNARRAQLEKSYVYGMDREIGVAYGAQQIARQQAESAKKEIKELDTNEINDYIQGLAASQKPLEDQQAALQRNIDRWNGYKKAAEESNKALEAKTNKTKEDYEQMDKNNLLIERAANATMLFTDAVNANKNAIEQRDTVVQGLDMQGLVKQIGEQEKEVRRAQKEYANNQNDENKKKLEAAQNNLQGSTAAYQSATGKQWVDSNKLAEERINAVRAQVNEETKIKNAAIKDERTRRRAEFEQQIKELQEEEAEYKRTHNGRGSGTLDRKIANAKLKYDIDTENLDRQLADWIRNKNKELKNMEFDFNISQLQRAIELEQDWNEKLNLQEQLRGKNIQRIKDEAEEAKKAELGAYTDADLYSAYKNFRNASDIGGQNGAVEGYVSLMKERGITVDADSILSTFIEMTNKEEAINAQTNQKLKQQNEEYRRQDQDMLLDMASNYLSYEEKRLSITSQYEAARRKIEEDESMSPEKRAEMLGKMEDWYKDNMKNLSGGIAEQIFDWKGMWGNAEKVSITSVRRVITKLRDAAKTIGSGGNVSDADKSLIAKELGITPEQTEDMLKNTEELESVLEEFLSMYDEKMMNLSGNATQDISEFFNKFKEKCEKEGMKPAESFKETIKEMFTLENLGGILSGISSVVKGISEGLDKIADATGNAKMSDAAEVLGGIAQNFAAAGQGAASGGWVGAIVAGLTDALGQAFTAITESIKGSKEVVRLAKAYKQELKEIRYEQELAANGDTIFGDNSYGNLVAALNTIKDVGSEMEKQQGLFAHIGDNVQRYLALNEEAAEQSRKDFNSWEIFFNIITAGATLGLENLLRGQKQVDEFYSHLTEDEKDTIEALSGGNVDGYLEKLAETGDVLGSMTIRVAKYGKNKWQTLSELAPEIWNEDGTINTEALDAFLSTYGDKLTTEQRALLEQIKADTDAFNDAVEQALDYYAGLFGGIGDSIMDSFVEGFKTGEDAMDSFTESLESNLEQWILDMARMAYIQPVLQQMQDMVEGALRNGGDVNAAVEEALAFLYDNYGQMQEGVSNTMQQAKDKFDELYGTTLFEDEDAEPEADKGGLQSMSQDTADELNARFTALQMEGAAVVSSTDAMLNAITLMQANSDRSVLLVQDIDRFQQLAYEQAQERVELIRTISDSVRTISSHTARLQAIEQNTEYLK